MSRSLRGGRLALCSLSPYLAEFFHIDALCEEAGSQAAALQEVADVAAAIASFQQNQSNIG